MDIRLGLQRTGPLDVDRVRMAAERLGFRVFVLPTSGIGDRAGFFEAVRSTLPLDPPLVGSSIWDALADSLWEGLLQCEAQRIAIVWQGTARMANADAAEFAMALDVLSDVALSLANPQATVGAVKEVAILVE